MPIFLISCGGSSDTFVVKGGIGAATEASEYSTEAGTPTQMYVKVKRMWLLPSEDCTPEAGNTFNDYLVQNRSSFVEFDVVLGPTVFSASPAAGTYNCMVMETKDIMKFKPDQEAEDTHGSAYCSTSQYYYHDVFHGSDNWYNPLTETYDSTTDENQLATSSEYASDTLNQTVYHFVSTDPSEVEAIYNSGNNIASALTLTDPIVITSDATTTLTFSILVEDKITRAGEGTSCTVEQPGMTIQ